MTAYNEFEKRTLVAILNGSYTINVWHATDFAKSGHVKIQKNKHPHLSPVFTLTESGKALAEQFAIDLAPQTQEQKEQAHTQACWERYLYNYNTSFKTDWQYNVRTDGAELDTLVVKADTTIVALDRAYTLAQMKEAVRLASHVEISPVSFE